MSCANGHSAAERNRSDGVLRGRCGLCRAALAALALILAAPAASAADLSDAALRGSITNFLSPRGYARWDGLNFGVQLGVSNMNSDFGNSASSLIAFILRNTAVEDEFSPSSWTTLPSNTTNGRQIGAFLGYNFQWDQLVVGFDAAYNRPSTLESSASDSISRRGTTSDSILHVLTVSARSSLKLVDYATMRARAGYAFGQFLPYATLGAAVGRFNYSNMATVTDDQTPPPPAAPFTFGPVTRTDSKDNAIVGGFLVGLGMDVALLPNVFLRGEWEFVAFSPVGGIRANINTGRVALGMKF